jgi:hypothetical protein
MLKLYMTISAVIHDLTNMMVPISRILTDTGNPFAQALLFTLQYLDPLKLYLHELLKLLNYVNFKFLNIVNPSSLVKHSNFNPLL